MEVCDIAQEAGIKIIPKKKKFKKAKRLSDEALQIAEKRREAKVFLWQNSAFSLLHFVLQGQTCLLLQVSLDFLLFHSSPR